MVAIHVVVRDAPLRSCSEHEDGDDRAADRADERADDGRERRVGPAATSTVDVDDAVRGERAEEPGGDHADERDHDHTP